MKLPRDPKSIFKRLPDILLWIVAPSGRPSPGFYKRATIRKYANRHRTPILVETGTLHGDTVAYALKHFRRIISIELDERLADMAKQRFEQAGQVTIIHGDSAVELPNVLSSLEAPTLFWLDGHYSGAGTARADVDTPIVAELESILKTQVASIILIDDAREFVGRHGYPTLNELTEVIASLRPSAQVEVARDVVRVVAMKTWDLSPDRSKMH